MRCIFCLHDRPGTREHVFPRAIGGRLTMNRVCKDCNSNLGRRVDAAVSDNFLIRGRRARLGLAGASGKPPAIHESLLGVWNLSNNLEQRVELSFNEQTQKVILRALPNISDVIRSDGTKAVQIIVDEQDVHQLAKIIQRERKRRGFSPLSADDLEREVGRLKNTGKTTEIMSPSVILDQTHSFAYLQHGLAKIAYELAFLWLGESYLDDTSAQELRIAIMSEDASSTDQLPARFGGAEGFEAFEMWPSNDSEHIAYAFAGDDGIAIAVRLFDIHAAFVWVTREREKFLCGGDAVEKLRFIQIHAVNGTTRDVPIMQEFERIAADVVAKSAYYRKT